MKTGFGPYLISINSQAKQEASRDEDKKSRYSMLHGVTVIIITTQVIQTEI